MLKLFVYGYSYGWKSCRKLQRAIHHNLSFIWLMGGLRPDYKTISEFRRKNKKVLKRLLKRCVRMCIELGLIDGNVLFVDGSKIRANAARGKNYTKGHYEEKLSETDRTIDNLFEECDRIDKEGDKLVREGRQDGYKKIGYRIKDAGICKGCRNYGECTRGKKGRKAVRLLPEEVKEKLEVQYEQSESQEVYKRRKLRVEHPFGYIKKNLGMTNFLLRGREGAQAEFSLAATCFNIVRMITLFGGPKIWTI